MCLGLDVQGIMATQMRKLTATHEGSEDSEATMRLVASHMANDAETAPSTTSTCREQQQVSRPTRP